MILHLIPDEKFTDAAYNAFNQKFLSVDSKFLVMTKNKNLKYTTMKHNMEIIHPLELLKKSFLRSLENYDFVVLHWLDIYKMNLIYKASKNVKFLWVGWGGDYYEYLNIKLFLNKTLEIKQKLQQRVGKSIIEKIKKLVFYKVYTSRFDILKRIDYFAPVLEEEYFMMKNSIKNFNAKYIDWNYGNIEDDIIKTSTMELRGNNILLGNSATFENNHIEALSKLENLNLQNKKIIMPLSYGDNEYKQYLISYLRNLHLNIEVLSTFVPLEEYYEMVSSCSVVIMNHIRQQGLGNIIMMMYAGSKIFLNGNNPIYIHYKKLGAHIYKLEELNNHTINMSLTEEQIYENKHLLMNELSREIMMEKTKYLIKTIKAN